MINTAIEIEQLLEFMTPEEIYEAAKDAEKSAKMDKWLAIVDKAREELIIAINEYIFATTGETATLETIKNLENNLKKTEELIAKTHYGKEIHTEDTKQKEPESTTEKDKAGTGKEAFDKIVKLFMM